MATIPIRVDDEKKKVYEQAAKVAGKSLSAWMKDLADAAAGIVAEKQVPRKPGEEVTAEYLPGAEKSSGGMREYDPNGGPVTQEPVPGEEGALKHGKYDPSKGEVTVVPDKEYTGETAIRQGKMVYEVITDRGKRWTYDPPPVKAKKK